MLAWNTTRPLAMTAVRAVREGHHDFENFRVPKKEIEGRNDKNGENSREEIRIENKENNKKVVKLDTRNFSRVENGIGCKAKLREG